LETARFRTPPEERPDNRASWDAISAAYQVRLGWPEDRLAWGIRCPPEDELRCLGDVRGKRALVLGCGGGQDCVALWKMGARAITGVDISEKQLEHAVRLLDEHSVEARLIHGSAEDLSMIPEASVDVAVSVHALNYVERADRCFAETHRVLMPGGAFAFSVQHPADASTRDEPPYGFEKPYFEAEFEWEWTGLGRADARFRSYYRTVADWFGLLRDAGFAVERLLEPPATDDPAWRESPWRSLGGHEKYETVPGTLNFVARKPEERP
jgi:SAM-dependent methyltransferase